jgi:hypothetical protein
MRGSDGAAMLRSFLLHGGLGLLLSALLVGGLLLTDPGGAGGVLLAAEEWWPALLLWLFAGMGFGAGLFATRLSQGESGRPRPRGGSGAPAMGLVPARVRARPRR